MDHFQRALHLWNELRLPYQIACTREMKGVAYGQMDDHDNSELEFAAAKWTFQELGASLDLARVKNYDNQSKSFSTHNLSLREFQVLELLVSGKTNRNIGAELFISEANCG